MIHVAWTVAAKVRVEDTVSVFKELAEKVDYFEKDHPLRVSLRAAVEAIENVEKEMDETYDVPCPSKGKK